MTTTPTTLTTDELRAQLQAHDVTYSDSQLKRLRRAGLLAAAGQYHRPGRRGSETLYPSSAVEQLLLIAHLNLTERRFAQLCVAVRWNGGWVRPDALRSALATLLDAVSAHARGAVEGAIDADDRADRLAVAIAGRGTSGLSRLVRERLADISDGTERAAFACAALSVGTTPEWDNHDPDDPTPSLLAVFEIASGIDRARTDNLAGQGPLLRDALSTDDHMRELQQSGLFDLFDLGAAIVDAPDDAIEQAFEDALALAGLREPFEAIQHFAGRDAAGLAFVSELDQEDGAVQRAGLVRTMLLMRPLLPASGLESVVDAARDALPALRRAVGLAEALPHLARFVAPDGAQRLAELSEGERERVIAEVRAHLAQTDPPQLTQGA